MNTISLTRNHGPLVEDPFLPDPPLHSAINCFIETKVNSRHTSFGHLSFRYLLLVCMATAALELRGVTLFVYFIMTVELFLIKNVPYSGIVIGQICNQSLYQLTVLLKL